MEEKLILPNGVRIVYEHMPSVRSASIGLWVGVGSRHEKAAENGAAHFIEHMLFKGTQTRTAGQLALEMDAIGGQINACTTRENTCYYAQVLDTHLDKAVELLADMFFNSRFDERDFANERGVIAGEISLYDDEPEDLVTERLVAGVYPGALGRPVAGTLASLRRFTAAGLHEFQKRHYIAPRIVIALAGSFTQKNIRHIAALFSALPNARDTAPRSAVYKPVFRTRRKAIEQNHICLGFPAYAVGDDERFALQILNTVTGGGMSSRLFQRVREERGLCYEIYSFTTAFREVGLFGVYAGFGRETQTETLRLMRDELCRLRDGGITAQELSCAREQARTGILMALESTSAHMNKLGWGELMLGSCLSTEQLLERYDAVTLDEVRTLAARVLDPAGLSLSAVGRVLPAEEYRLLFE